MVTRETMNQRKDIYQDRVKAELDKLNAQIAEFRAKADQSKADARIRYNDTLEELTTKQEAAQLKLQELQRSSESAWKDIQSGFESAWNDLQVSFQNALSKFDNDR